MLSVIQMAAVVVVASCVVLTLKSEGFAFAVSRVMEAAFERVEYRLALRARTRAERLKVRRREERRRASRTRGEAFAPAEAYYSHAG
jgi:low temperature requirement protein LtrA